MVCSYCRAAVQPGSRFCNACGTPLAAPAPAAQQPTQQWQQQPAQPTQQWQNPSAGAAQQTVAWDPAQVNGQYAAAAPVPAKKPWLILSLLLALIAGAVGVAAVAITRGGNPLTAQSQKAVPPGSGVVQTTNPQLPQGPNAVNSQSGLPTSGSPVTGSVKGKDDMAPSVMMSQGGNPNAPSVTGAQQPRIPTAPSMTGQVQTAQPATPMTAQPQAPPVPDNADFDKYLKWLRYVENERAGLRAQGETVAFQQIEGYLNAMITMSDPDPSADLAIENFQAQNTQMLNRTVQAIQAFRANVIQSRRALLVPADCKGIDAYYMKALDQEIATTAALMSAMANKNMGQIRSIGTRGVGSIDMNLGMANKELKKAYEGRGLNQLFTIETGGNSSMLGGLTGIGGLK